jgi:FkbM family methyltransferase
MRLTDILTLGGDNDVAFSQRGFVGYSTFAHLSHHPFLIYGAGEATHWFYEVGVIRQGLKPIAVVDRRAKEIPTYQDLPCISPDDAVNQFCSQNLDVVVCVGDFDTFLSIRKDLLQKGFSKVHYQGWFYEIHNLLETQFVGELEWLQMFEQSEESIVHAHSLMADSLSRQLYAKLISCHFRRQARLFPRRPREEQHFPKDVPLSKGYSSLVVCGAYDGEVLRLLKEHQIKPKQIYLFEPEADIFKRLVSNVGQYQHDSEIEVLAIPMAISDNTSMVNFFRGDGLGSKISLNGNSKVQATSLDDFLGKNVVSMITMDIEGHESAALKGAAKLISEQKPDLSISVYHDPKQLWEIPSLIMSISSGYKFYLRNYTSYAIETVLYATHV